MIESLRRARTVLHSSISQSEFDQVMGVVCLVWKQKPKDVLSRRRLGELIPPRHAGMAILHERGHSLVSIGKAFKGRDHGAVLHALKNVRAWNEIDKKFRAKWALAQKFLDETDNGPNEVCITVRCNIPGYRQLDNNQVLLSALRLIQEESPRVHSVFIEEADQGG